MPRRVSARFEPRFFAMNMCMWRHKTGLWAKMATELYQLKSEERQTSQKMNGNQNEDLKVPRYRDMRTGDAPIHLPTTPFPQCIERNPTTRLQAARTRTRPMGHDVAASSSDQGLAGPPTRRATTWLQAARTRAWLVLPHARWDATNFWG